MLEELVLAGTIHIKDFNFKLFDIVKDNDYDYDYDYDNDNDKDNKKLCSRLTSLDIDIDNINEICLEKLFYGLHFEILSYLRINSSRITKLEKKFFDGLPKLQTLIICRSQELRKINIDSFSNLKQLRRLDLSLNCIESLEKGYFSELISLESLDLSGNQIEIIEDNMFLNLYNLRILDLSFNRIYYVNPESFVGLRNLKELNLSVNNLTKFPRYFV